MIIRTRAFRPGFDQFDHTFDQLSRSFFAPGNLRTPTVDATWRDGAYALTVDLPGVPAEAVEVTVAGRTLIIAVRTEELTWERSLTLGWALDPEQVTARHVDGRLTVTVGAVPAVEPRRITVGSTAPEIEPVDVKAGDDAQDAAGTETTDSEG